MNDKTSTDRRDLNIDELIRYERSVRRALDEHSTNLICNSSHDHAAIILRLLCSSAKKQISIFCGGLRKSVYGGLCSSIQAAVKRGVKVRIVTEQGESDIETKELACNDKGWEWRSLGRRIHVPHLVLVDDDKFRLELSAQAGAAIVCTGVGDDEDRKRMVDDFRDGFQRIWDVAAEPAVRHP